MWNLWLCSGNWRTNTRNCKSRRTKSRTCRGRCAWRTTCFDSGSTRSKVRPARPSPVRQLWARSRITPIRPATTRQTPVQIGSATSVILAVPPVRPIQDDQGPVRWNVLQFWIPVDSGKNGGIFFLIFGKLQAKCNEESANIDKRRFSGAYRSHTSEDVLQSVCFPFVTKSWSLVAVFLIFDLWWHFAHFFNGRNFLLHKFSSPQ